MTFDSLLSLLGLAVAIYALLPRYRHLDLTLRTTKLDVGVVLVALAAVHYLQFYETFRAWQLTPPPGWWKVGISPHDLSYLVVLAASLFVALHMRSFRLSPRKLEQLRDLFEELLWQRKYAEIVGLLNQHLEPLTNALSKEKTAQDITRTALTNYALIREIALHDPYLGLRILEHKPTGAAEFCYVYMSELLSHPLSAICIELRNNQNQANWRYDLPESNRILHYLLGDVSTSHRLAAYRPVGDTAIRHLRALCGRPQDDPHLRPMGNWRDDGFYDTQWDSPVFLGLRFFDIMIKQALFQDAKWHMWLFYMPPITEAILANYNELDPNVDREAESPTRYSYLLRTILDMHCDWLRHLTDLPADNSQRSIRTSDLRSHQNENIPKSAAISLGQCLKAIINSPKLGVVFKRKLLEIPVSLHSELQESEAPELLIASLGNAITQDLMDRSQRYTVALRAALAEMDPVRFPEDRLRMLKR